MTYLANHLLLFVAIFFGTVAALFVNLGLFSKGLLNSVSNGDVDAMVNKLGNGIMRHLFFLLLVIVSGFTMIVALVATILQAYGKP